MELSEKLQILADAAKYDVSCSSSGSTHKRNATIGTAAKAGIAILLRPMVAASLC